MFSIIVPCYNLEDYIQISIESVLNQTYSNFELILVNDGSVDNTLNILKSYEKQYERIVIIDKENGGVSSARNRGLEIARGEYIYFLDGDDTVESNLLENAKEFFDRNSNVDIFSFGFNIIDENNNILKSHVFANHGEKIIDSNQFLSLYFNKRIRQCMCSFIVKKDLLINNNLKFSKDIAYGEDQEMQLKAIFHSNKIYYDSKCYFHYLKRNDSAVNKKINIKRIDLIKSFERLKLYFENHNIKEVILSDLNNYIGIIFLFLLKEGKQKQGDTLYFDELNKYVYHLKNVSFSFSKYGIINFIFSKIYLNIFS
jgi:glycosyltransferase involved in cell wall biosynthesis